MTTEDSDDVYEKVKAPCWANSLLEANADTEEADDSFFPEAPEIAQVVEELAHIAVQEDPTDLSRLAMFGNKRQIKRRSQIKREEEAATSQSLKNKPSEPPERVASYNRLQNRSSSSQQDLRNPSAERASVRGRGSRNHSVERAPTTRSWNPSAERTSVPVIRSRNASVERSSNPVTHLRNPSVERSSGPVTRSQTHALPRISVPIPRATTGIRNLPRNDIVKRAPVTVKTSPRPAVAFGSAVRPKPQEPRTSVIRPRRELTKTPTFKAPHLRDYPTPSGITPARPLTKPETPVLLKRHPSRSSSLRNRSSSQDANKRFSNPQIQGMVERLSKPKLTALSIPMATPTKKVPNTYTHGIHSSKVRRNVPRR